MLGKSLNSNDSEFDIKFKEKLRLRKFNNGLKSIKLMKSPRKWRLIKNAKYYCQVNKIKLKYGSKFRVIII